MLAPEQQAPFDDPRDAIRWADNYLLRPDCKTITGKLVEDNVQQIRGPRRMVDAHSLAITITTSLSSVPAPFGHSVRLVYGRGEDYRLELADRMAHATWAGPEGGRTIGAARDLAIMVIEQVKEEERRNKRVPTNAIAEAMKLSRGHFYAKWGKVRREMKALFKGWVEKGVSQVDQKLVDAGVV